MEGQSVSDLEELERARKINLISDLMSSARSNPTESVYKLHVGINQN